MNHELTSFLTRHRACTEGLSRLAATGAATPEEAWARADARDLIWAVTRPVVMSKMQRRKFLVFVLESIEDKLTDKRSKNILDKLRTNSPITEAEAWSAAAAYAARAAAEEAADAAADAAWAAAADAAAARAAARAAEEAADAAWDAACAAWAAWAASREAQAKWIRENFALSDLNIN